MKKFVSLLLSVALITTVIFFAPASTYASAITTPATSLYFAKGCSNTLVMYLDGKRAGGGSLSFKSGNKSIATVDSNGKVSAKKRGTVTITVKSKRNSKVYKNIKITVVDGKSFSVTPNSAPLNGLFLNYGTYNSKTKNYYTIRSYLEYFEKHGGCSLTMKKGTYSVTNVLYVPSNSKIKLEDGVTLNKASSTGSNKLTASSTLFALCAPSKASIKNAYSGYSGVHDVTIIGSGSATISMKNAPKNKISVAVVMCHNKNVTISGIKFTNLKYGHFIELDASKNVKITGCRFNNQVHDTENSPSECINIDTPDSKTNGFHQSWAKNDSYPNDTVNISDCSFYNVQRAIGTHQYSKNKYHKNISIKNNMIKKCVYGGIYAMNWKDTTIKNNTFNGIGKDLNGKATVSSSLLSSNRALLFAGCYDGLNVSGNSFSNCYQIGAVTTHQSNGYPMIHNSITVDEFNKMSSRNHCGKNVNCPYIKLYNNWDGKGSNWAVYYVEG